MPVLLGLCLETELTLTSNQGKIPVLNKLFPLPKFILFNGLKLELNSQHTLCTHFSALQWCGDGKPH